MTAEREQVEGLLNIIATGCKAGNEDKSNMMIERAVSETMADFNRRRKKVRCIEST